jgi:hypothetical protein
MYTEGAGQQQANSRRDKDLRDGERADKTRGKFAGLHPEGQIPSRKPYPLPKTVAGSRGPVVLTMATGSPWITEDVLKV